MSDALVLLLIVLLLVVAVGGVALITRSVVARAKADLALPSSWCQDKQDEDHEMTEVVPADLALAYLLAEAVDNGMPRRIELYTDQKQRIGRDQRRCEVVLSDIGISRKHAEIRHTVQGFRIRDLSSKGGTFVNCQRLRTDEERTLQPGDIVKFYSFEYRFEQADEMTEKPDDNQTE